MRKILTAAAAALALGAAAPALAQTEIYTAPSNPNGNQNWTGSLGLNFTVNGSGITIFSLGVFDDDMDGILGSLTVGIYTSTGTLVSPLVTFNNTSGTGNPFLYQAVTPFILGPGSYQLTSWGFGTDNNFNNSGPGGPILFNTLGGALTATGTQYNNPGVTGFANQNVDNGATRYGAASFIAAVPEPGTWAMMIGGFGIVGFGMRSRKRRDMLTA